MIRLHVDQYRFIGIGLYTSQQSYGVWLWLSGKSTFRLGISSLEIMAAVEGTEASAIRQL